MLGLPKWETKERFGMVHVDFNDKELPVSLNLEL